MPNPFPMGLPRLPTTPGGSVNTIGNPDLKSPNLLASLGPQMGGGAPEDLGRLFMEAIKPLDALIAVMGATSDPLSTSPFEDSEGTLEELSDIRARLRELALRAAGPEQEAEGGEEGSIGPAGEGETNF